MRLETSKKQKKNNKTIEKFVGFLTNICYYFDPPARMCQPICCKPSLVLPSRRLKKQKQKEGI